jgi:ATP-binding cassette, subfamily C, bacterial CydD
VSVRELPALRRQFALAGAVSVPIAACVVVQALALAAALAAGMTGAAWTAAGLVALAAFAGRSILGYVAEVAGRRAGAAAMRQLRERLIAATLSGAPVDRGDRRAGELATLAVQGGAAVERWAGRAVPQMALAVAVPAAALGAIAWLDPLSAALLAPTIPLLIVFLALAGGDARRVADDRFAALALLGAHMLDVLRGLGVLRSFGRERVQEQQLQIAGEAYRRSAVATLRSAFTSAFALEFVAMLGTALVAVVAGVRLVNASMEFETAMGVLLLAPELYLPLRRIGVEHHAAADARATLKRVGDAGARPALVPAGRPGAGIPDPGACAIELDEVVVRPPGAGRDALSGLTLTIEPQSVVAIVGPSGAGKSTLLRVLLALQQPHEGYVSCGGRVLEECDLEGWRGRLAWLPQRPVILPATLADNLRLADVAADERKLWQALEVARLDDWARTLPGGLDARLGDGGVAISAGERRRLGVARVALRDARLVLADEPTANLDSETARLVVESLAAITAGRTAVLVTHQDDALELAARVVGLRDGRLAEAVVIAGRG